MAELSTLKHRTTASHRDGASSFSISSTVLKRSAPLSAGLSPGPGPQTALRITVHLSCKQRSDAVREAIRLQGYKTPSRVLPDHTIIHRPDCVVPIQLADCSLHHDRPS
jgi:hypothetical protein